MSKSALGLGSRPPCVTQGGIEDKQEGNGGKGQGGNCNRE